MQLCLRDPPPSTFNLTSTKHDKPFRDGQSTIEVYHILNVLYKKEGKKEENPVN